jgi:hypothetical protein
MINKNEFRTNSVLLLVLSKRLHSIFAGFQIYRTNAPCIYPILRFTYAILYKILELRLRLLENAVLSALRFILSV